MAYYQPAGYYQPPPHVQAPPQSYYGYDLQQAYYTPQPQPQPPTEPPPQVPQALPPPPPVRNETPVQAPVAFTRISLKTPASTTQKSEERPSGWPDSLRRYTQRAFIEATSPGDKARLQVHLKNMITNAQDKGQLWTTDWETMPLPDLSLPSAEPVAKAGTSRESLMSVVRPTSPFKMSFRKQVQKRERSLSPVPREYIPAKPLSKKDRKSLKLQKKEQRSATAFHSDVDSLQDQQREQARARRFGNGSAIGAVSGQPTRRSGGRIMDSPDEAERESEPYSDEGFEVYQEGSSAVKGTCQEVEKSYFRLTSKPDPSVVRPEPVLQRALTRLVDLLRRKQVNYFYASDQFKGMRQDCTVQHLHNALSASIYEAHARSALEYGDTAEYNQCQAQLLQHYQTGIKGAQEEFAAYRLLHQSVHAGRGNNAGVLFCLQSLTLEDASHPFVQHALQVRRALALGDCVQVCALYNATPNMGHALLDMVMPRVRLTALKVLAKAHLPHLPVSVIASRLAFVKSPSHTLSPPYTGASSIPRRDPANQIELPGSTSATFIGRYVSQGNTGNGEESCIAWLREHGAVLIPMPGFLDKLAMDCKASVGRLKAPETASNAPQGPDLAIDDFLARAVA